MKIVLWANDEKCIQLSQEILESVHRVDNLPDFVNMAADVYVNFNDNAGEQDYSKLTGNLVLNSVISVTTDIRHKGSLLRINGWNSFLNNDTWEYAGIMNEVFSAFIALIGKKLVKCPDVPGLISARVIAMIINEAFLALEDGISTKDDINTAMRLGTGYPYGPFQWADIIGTQNIKLLLQKLSVTDNRYMPAENL